MTPGYEALTARDALVTGDGLIRSHQCEQDAKGGARPISPFQKRSDICARVDQDQHGRPKSWQTAQPHG